MRYVDNPNGSVDSIAGVCNTAGNVVGLMPHPERASDSARQQDGLVFCAPQRSGQPLGQQFFVTKNDDSVAPVR